MESSISCGLTYDERRHSDPNRQALMYRLSTSQKHSVNGLNQYGYQLAFLRNDNSENLAVLICGDNMATVNEQGDIDTSPGISIRQ